MPRAALYVALTLLAATAAYALTLASCSSPPRPDLYLEAAGGSGAWAPTDAIPAWVTTPPRADDRLVTVQWNRSNLRGIAAHVPSTKTVLERRVRAALTPVVGDDAAQTAAAAAAQHAVIVARASEEFAGDGETVGGSLATVWTLVEVPLEPVLAAVPAERRDAARAALLGLLPQEPPTPARTE